MNAVVMCGGIPQPGELLYEECQGRPKALLDIAGKPMVQWVLDALDEAAQVEQVVLVGLQPEEGVHSRKLATSLPDQGGLLLNMRAGAQEIRRWDPAAQHALFVSGDIPGLRGEMVDWLVDAVAPGALDIYYTVVERKTMEARYPGSHRTYTRLRDMEICGGDMNVGRISLLLDREGPWEELLRRRKNPLAQAALLGFDTLFLLLIRALTLDQAIDRVVHKLGITGTAIISPYAEIGMDVDKPDQLALMRKDLVAHIGEAPQA
jgi:GTP:adenosylcobinamide-phosphate guanylyltransferase